MTTWKAEVTLSGVPTPSDETLDKIISYFPGVARHEADTQQFFLLWRFEGNGMDGAMAEVSAMRSTVAQDLGGNAVCTDLRIRKAYAHEYAAQMAKMFGETP